jgi:hypothetical protein
MPSMLYTFFYIGAEVICLHVFFLAFTYLSLLLNTILFKWTWLLKMNIIKDLDIFIFHNITVYTYYACTRACARAHTHIYGILNLA